MRIILIRSVLAGGVILSMMLAAAALGPPQVVEARLVASTDAVHPGEPARLAVVAKIAPGFHINEHHPTLDYLIPSELKLQPTPGVTVENIFYPPGQLKKFEFSDDRLSVYEGTVVIGARLGIARTVHPGEITLEGKFAYQACNDQACLPPTSVPVTLQIRVVARGVPLKPLNADIFKQVRFQ